MDKFKKNLVKKETDKKQKSTISFEETLERLNKKKSKDLTVNDLQYEINIVKQEINKLKYNNKSDNNHIKPMMIMLKVDKSNSEHNEHKDGDESSQQGVVFSVSPSVSTRNFGILLLCSLLSFVGAILVVK